MRMKEFTETLATKMEARLNGVKVTPTTNWKNNGILREGLTICKVGEPVAPILYIDHLFHRFGSGELSIEDILEQVISDYENLSTPIIPDLHTLLSAVDFIDKIRIRLVNLDENKKMIEERHLLHYELENTGLVCLFYAKVFTEDNSTGEIGLSEAFLKQYLPQIDNAEALYQVIIEKSQDVYFEPMQKVIIEMLSRNHMDDSILDMIETTNNFMYVLSNTSKNYGASTILTETARQKILNQFPNGKVTIFPSSVHELILIRTEDDENIENLQQMVQEINHTELSKEDFLSDNVYHFDAHTGKLTIAGSEVDSL